MKASGRAGKRSESREGYPGRSWRLAPPLLVIVGPTAVGKTSLSIHLSKAFGGEVISADSRSFYRDMDIGTAKPTPEERAQVSHHLIDIADPDETVGLAEFQDLAYAAIDDVRARGELPLLVGGTGQYVQAVVEGWRIPRVPPHPHLREELERRAEEESPYALHDWLRQLDPEAAEDIHPHNVRRVVRALEVCLVTGHPISEQQGKQPPPYPVFQVGLTMDRELLYKRVDRRLELMIEAGLMEEVRELLQAGYDWSLPAMSAVGYAEFEPLFAGEATLDEVIEEIRSDLRHLIRHQYNWFSLDDPDIHWFDVAHTTYQEIELVVDGWLSQQ